MTVEVENHVRWRSILIAREFKWLFKAVPTRCREWLTGLIWQWLFVSAEGKVHRAGEIALADLRDFAGFGRAAFNSDPLIMARHAGRQDVVWRMINYLNLDEMVVTEIMELDDGLGE